MTPSDSSSSSSCSCSSHFSSSEDLAIVLRQSAEDSGDEENDLSPKSRKDTRPLPQLPLSLLSPPNSPSYSPPSSATRKRPLPPTPHLKTDSVCISVTPATPLPTPSPRTQSPNHLSPPKIRRLPQPLLLEPRPLSAQSTPPSHNTVIVSPPSYQCSSGDTLIPSPNSTLEFPTPTVARRRRLSKLKRFLGETVPDELVPVISSARDPQAAQDLLDHLSSRTPLHVHTDLEPPLDPAVISKRLQELEEDECFSDDEEIYDGGFTELVFASDEESLVDDRTGSWLAEGNNPLRAIPLPTKYTKKWVWDKGGRRKEEDDYEDILRALRSLWKFDWFRLLKGLFLLAFWSFFYSDFPNHHGRGHHLVYLYLHLGISAFCVFVVVFAHCISTRPILIGLASWHFTFDTYLYTIHSYTLPTTAALYSYIMLHVDFKLMNSNNSPYLFNHWVEWYIYI